MKLQKAFSEDPQQNFWWTIWALKLDLKHHTIMRLTISKNSLLEKRNQFQVIK